MTISLPERALIYARVSTVEQGKGYSLDTQVEAMRRYCDERGYVLAADPFRDTFSGTELDRPGMNVLLETAAALRPDVVVIYDVDRLGREIIVQAILERDIGRAGARIEYVLGGDTGTLDGELLKTIKGALAVYENRQRVERSRRGKNGRVQAGYPLVPGRRAPFGYRYVAEHKKGQLVINEDEAEVVQQMVRWLLVDRLSSYEIAKRLWQEGILTRGDQFPTVVIKKSGRGEWSPATVRRILSNPLYKGEWYWGKTRRKKIADPKTGKERHVQVKAPPEDWIRVEVPAILEGSTWDRVQAVLSENQHVAGRRAKRDYLLQGMVFCTCGRRFTGRYKNHLDRAYYRCPTSEKEYWRKSCPTRFGYRQELLEAAVWDYVAAELLNADTLITEVERRRAEQAAEIDRREHRVRGVEADLVTVDIQLGALLTRELDGYPQSVIDAEKQRLLARRQSLETERVHLSADPDDVVLSDDAAAMLYELAEMARIALPAMTPAERHNLLQLLRVRVEAIDREHVRVSGILSGSVLALSSGRSSQGR